MQNNQDKTRVKQYVREMGDRGREMAQTLMEENIHTGIVCGYANKGFPLYYANAKAIAMLGYDSYEDFCDCTGGFLMNVVHPDDLAQLLGSFKSDYKEGDSFENSFRAIRKDGSSFWIVEKGKIFTNENGERVFIGLCTDISEMMRLQKKMEQAQARGAQYKQALMSDAVAVMEVNLTQNEILDSSMLMPDGSEEQLLKAAGYEGPSRYGEYITYWSRFVEPEYREAFKYFFSYDQLTEKYKRGQREVVMEYWTQDVFGRRRFAHQIVLMEQADQSDDIMALIMTKDYTERLEGALEEARKLEVISGLSEDYESIFYVDLDKNTIYPYRVAEDIEARFGMGMRKCAFEGCMESYIMEAVHPADREKLRETNTVAYIKEKLETEKTVFLNYRTIHMNSVEIHQQKAIRVGDEGRISKVILAYRSIEKEHQEELEKQKQLEDALVRAEEASRSKSSFLFNMSHDIRTPMNAILGFASMAKKHVDDREKVLDCLDKVASSGEHLLELINDVLDMSRIESGKVIIEEEPVDLLENINQIISILRNDMERKGLEFTTGFDVKDRFVFRDKLRCSQVTLNLLGNAMKYTKPGGRVHYGVKQLPDERSDFATYEIIVKDTGIGMSEEFLKHIFEPFERASTTTVSGVQGSGLGMAITKGILDMLGGTIEVKSTLGEGTEIRVVLSHRKQLCPYSVETASAKEELDFTGKRVLLVEDNDLNREIACEILAEAGFVVEEAVDGAVAVEKIRQSKVGDYDLVLMDIQMPYVDGYKATKMIRMLENEQLARIPIIAMTANAFDEDRRRALACGMDEHLAKPIDINRLMQILCTFVLSENSTKNSEKSKEK